MIKIYLYKSDKPDKKYMIKFINQDTDRINTKYFGAAGMDDFLITNDINQKNRYISRHSGMNEDWGKSGIYTPGFWSRWLLWEKPTINESIKNIEKKFNIKIVNYIDGDRGGGLLNEKHSAYRSMKLSQLKLSKPTNKKNEGDLLRWQAEKWQNLTALLTDNKFYNCGSKGKKQIEMNLLSVCRPSKRISKETPILGSNYTKEQIMKAIEIKKRGGVIKWREL